jgi:hypothetical protein
VVERSHAIESEVRAMRAGHWLRALARRVCSARTNERLVDPAVADLRFEIREARSSGRLRRGVVATRGYLAVWSMLGRLAVVSAARATALTFRGAGSDGARTARYAVTVTVLLSGAIAASPLSSMPASADRLTTLFLMALLLPQGVPIAVPFGVSLGLACGLRRPTSWRNLIAASLPLATAGALAVSIVMFWAIPAANVQWRTTMGQLAGRPIEMRGASEMPLPELAARIDALNAAGRHREANRLREAYHLRWALPFAPLVLGAFALAVSVSARHHRPAIRAGLVCATCVGYFVVPATLQRSAPPAATFWLTNALLLAAAGFMLWHAAGLGAVPAEER